MGLRGDAMGPNEVPAGAMVRAGRFPGRCVLMCFPRAREEVERRGNLWAPRGSTGTPWGLHGDTMEFPMASLLIPVAPLWNPFRHRAYRTRIKIKVSRPGRQTGQGTRQKVKGSLMKDKGARRSGVEGSAAERSRRWRGRMSGTRAGTVDTFLKSTIPGHCGPLAP